MIGLYHEMSHALDIVQGELRTGTYNGTDTVDRGVRDLERAAVGLPIDHDGDPATPEQTVTDPALTENGLRGEMQIDPRPSYR